ncbi:hypothetical protein MF406_07320 [Georgenia sp. TF02-10]|uniref:hypothetical protein n=1 Tax=Georgenia sp. TF02-10 TaxID=2917725 RepID=UPI001FA6CBDF|nr:hypothetical protein [Georgenia sp. TF02-10]UNX56019.1 hypothetical protein MF406_07320 [Georgenia sp. TF02-10]
MVADLSFHIEVQPFAADGLVAARWTGRGTTTDGTESGFFGNDILTVRADRLAEYRVASGER